MGRKKEKARGPEKVSKKPRAPVAKQGGKRKAVEMAQSYHPPLWAQPRRTMGGTTRKH